MADLWRIAGRRGPAELRERRHAHPSRVGLHSCAQFGARSTWIPASHGTMAYPFPRCARTAGPGAPAPVARPHHEPPFSAPAAYASPVGALPLLSRTPDGESSGPPPVECNEALIAMFAEMRLRGQQRGAATRRSPSHRAQANPSVALPQQEDEASRSAMSARARDSSRKEVLYGRHAPTVRALEASLNAEFDHISQVDRPPLWPSVPLRPSAHARTAAA